jgi:glycosyltransferase 2 family protein
VAADSLSGRPRASRAGAGLSPARLGAALAGLLGVALAIAVVGWFGATRVLSAVTAIGVAGFIAYGLYSLACFPITGAAWWVLSRTPASRLPAFVFGRMLREAASDILPFSSVGGVVIGTRGVLLRGVEPSRAYAATAGDLVTEILAQIAFLILGLTLLSVRLAGRSQAHTFELSFMVAIGVAIAMVASLLLAERRGFDLIGRLAARFAPDAAEHICTVQEQLGELRRRPWPLLASTAIHGAGWIASAVGSWVALRLMGVEISIPAVIAIESLLSAVKSAAFVVPNAVGVQEAAYAVIGQVFGLPGGSAVALSLIRRAKDLAIGAPVLIAWQALEGRRLVRPGADAV